MKTTLKGHSLALSLLCASNMAGALPVFINEFHYDNQGVDRDEFVEIAGQAGSSLEGWRLEFYNGGNGKRYMTWDLSGTLSAASSTLGVLAFSGSKGIQNGANDGIALIDDQGSLVQFISYEGQLSAVNGAAAGHSSVDVGVFESPDSAPGGSIQLQGSGELSTDFTWGLGSASQGLINSQQSFAFAAPEVVLPPISSDPLPLEPTFLDPLPLDPVSTDPGPWDPASPAMAVPEPASVSLLGLALLALGALRLPRQHEHG